MLGEWGDWLNIYSNICVVNEKDLFYKLLLLIIR